MEWTLRPERPSDYRTVETITRDAFWDVCRPGCDEHYLVHCLRQNPDWVPELDYVAQGGDDIIGNILDSRAKSSMKRGFRTRCCAWAR